MIIKLENYANEKGMLIQERTLVSGDAGNNPFDRFIGTVGIGMETPMGVQMQQIEFPILANTLEEAYSKFEQSARDFVSKKNQEARNQIVVARERPKAAKGLILP